MKNTMLLRSWSCKKYLQTFSGFSTISLHHKWRGTRLLSPESECLICHMSCRKTGTQEVRKFQGSPEMLQIHGKCPAAHQIRKFWQLCRKIVKNRLYNIPQKNLFYLISWICLQNFVQDLFVAPGSQSLKHSFQETLKRSFQDSLNPMYHCVRDTFLALHSHVYNWNTNSSKQSKWHWSKTLRKHWPNSNQYSPFWKRFFP